MQCRDCGKQLAEGAETCEACGSTLILVKSQFPRLEQLPLTPEAASAAHFQNLHEQIWQTLAEYQVQQKEQLEQLRGELVERFKVLETKPKAAPAHHHFWPRVSQDTASILFFALAGLIGFIWFIYKLVNVNKAIRFDNITILAATLTVIGSLYLAYDLLGRQHGPLRWVSLFVTSGLIGTIILEPIALPVIAMGDVVGALQILLLGVVLGGFSGVLFAIPEDPRHPRVFSVRSSMIGGGLGILFWGALLRVFVSSSFSLSLFLGIAVLLGLPTGILLGGFHHFFRGNYHAGRPPIFSWRSSLKALALLLTLWGIIALLALGGPLQERAMYGETVVIAIIALSSTIPSGFAPYVFWWLNHLPERVLGAVGFVLTLTGAILPVIQPISDILGALKG